MMEKGASKLGWQVSAEGWYWQPCDTDTIQALLRDLTKLNSSMLDFKNNPELAHAHLQHSLINEINEDCWKGVEAKNQKELPSKSVKRNQKVRK
jgi:hypothetical protein